MQLITFILLQRNHEFECFIPNDNFSPESGGKVKPNKAIDAINTQGIIRLKK